MSTVFTLLYVAALATGIVTIAIPPMSLVAEHGELAMQSVGVLLMSGAIIGMAGGAYTNGRLEQIGVGLQMWALVIYGAIALGLHLSSHGSRLTQIGVIVLALIGFAVRWLMIWRYERQRRG